MNDKTIVLLICATLLAGIFGGGCIGSPVPTETNGTTPEAINGLMATDAKDGKINLSWAASTASDFSEYRIYKSVSQFTNISDAVLVSTIANSMVTTYQITGLQSGLTYYFAVVAMDKSGNVNKIVTSISAKSTTSSIPPLYPIQVDWIVGNTSTMENLIYELDIAIALMPGVHTINLTSLRLTFIGANVSKTLDRGDNPSPTAYGVNDQYNYDSAGNLVDVYHRGYDPNDAYNESSTPPKYCLDKDSRLILVINLSTSPNGIAAPLPPSTEVALTLNVSGYSVNIVKEFRTPTVYNSTYVKIL